MIFDRVFRNVRVVIDDEIVNTSIAVANGKIVEIGTITSNAKEEIDGRSQLLIPGVIDTQVHFREPGLEHKEDIESGSRAALHGGVTSFLEMPNTKPETTNPEALAEKIRRATGRSWANFGFFIGASPSNATKLAEYENLPGCPGIKIFMGSSTGDLLVCEEEDLRQVLLHGIKTCPVHSEDEARNRTRKSLISASPHSREHPFLRDAESARISTEKLLNLCRTTNRPVHVLHISTLDELPLLKSAKAEGMPVTCEITPQQLWFSAPDCYEKLGTYAQMNPPIRSKEHNSALWKALDEELFDVFGSDHAPHTKEEKNQPYPSSPSGMPGVETLLPALLTFASQGRISIPKLVRMLCQTPAELYNIRGKGRIQVGFDADLLLIDTEKEWIVDEAKMQSKCGWSPYHGEKFTGQIERVYLGGELKLLQGKRIGNATGRVLYFNNSGTI
jgi:dihydroorotase